MLSVCGYQKAIRKLDRQMDRVLGRGLAWTVSWTPCLDRVLDRNTDRQIDSQTDRQASRQAGRQTDGAAQWLGHPVNAAKAPPRRATAHAGSQGPKIIPNRTWTPKS